MSNLRVCRRCLLRDLSDEDAQRAIKNLIDSMPESEKASEAVYNYRLEQCKKCDSLVSGTCVKCGCYVEARAAGVNAECPGTVNKWSEAYEQ